MYSIIKKIHGKRFEIVFSKIFVSKIIMDNLNQTFWEEYIHVDKLCKDMLGSDKGISTYIDIMDDTPIEYRRYANNFDEVYKQLKHLRWKRNQLAHEKENFNEPFAVQEDIDYITWFKKQIMAITDPLAVIKQELRKKENEREAQKRRWQQNSQQLNQTYTPPQQNHQQPNYSQPTYNKNEPKQSFFARLMTKIKNWLDG